MESYSLYELNEYIKRVIALNFTETIWVHAEIAQVQERRGQVYLELIDKTDDTEEIKAQSSAVIWYKSFLFIKNKLGELADSILQEGIVIKAKIQVDFHERYGMKLVIEDIDPSYTIGVLEMQRTEIIERLKKEGLFKLNKSLSLPSVIQRIAVISSKKAAGLKDFFAQVKSNAYGYHFKIELFQAAVQGKNLESEIKKRLVEIQERNHDFDIITIIRGGGSKIDLAGFDSYEVAKTIARSHLPVITGIGHEIDQNIADLMANQSLKTPTAVANWLIDHNLSFESNLISAWQQIQQVVNNIVKEQKLKIERLDHEFNFLPKSLLADHSSKIQYLSQTILNSLKTKLEQTKFNLESINNIVTLSHPDNTLKRGFAIIEKEGEVISSIDHINIKDQINIQLADGKLSSTIIQKEKTKIS